MFTGLVEEIGVMRRIGRKGEAMLLSISASRIMDDLKLGDSVSVNGVCLTATTINKGIFTVDVMPETYRSTNLKDLQPGGKVNLERAMAAGGRFGGHIVQGHVDGVGVIRSVQTDQNAVVYEVAPSNKDVIKYIIPKGSVTLDGISLTVVKTTETSFTVSIIPHTLAETVLADKKAGDTVNIETDILGKYVEHLLHFGSQDTGRRGGTKRELSRDYLAEHGFV
ncbi:riboflavin synthase subunit alpha [Bacillus sp. FJAT-18019]|uniref:Riboflavin synthase n=1 Tax=Paenibacillus solani TaxID=1705565 RepID=A0A0M1P306_9BACL|nr:riboflavin synthase [Paenibacillus solani]KOP63886.1 riboflavin synthase subunit alpha [Bacillus sp. FJAT-18019]KOR88695.1 riboflavin synthase subunit alpha [Paenibacillus solani]